MKYFICDAGLRLEEGVPPPSEEVVLCAAWIAEFAKKKKGINYKYSSYGLKHIVEKWARRYVSNGAFIQAAIDAGYEYQVRGQNGYFNMSLPRRYTERYYDSKMGERV